MSGPDDLEQVRVDDVMVGDYVIDREAGAGARCVIAKARAWGARDRTIGWNVALADGDTAYWPRGARVWRRRFGAARV